MAIQGTSAEQFGGFLKKWSDWMLGFGVLALMMTLLTPLPPALLDVLLATNIGLSLLLLLVTMNVRASAELSTFPTILLFVTLLRLGLNVASTRIILSEGKAGAIITAFGDYVIGDNLTVGLVVFLILIIIQFVVITKGAGRVSEVAARFVLDAMPGKQMAIDADLNAGLISSDDARDRRKAVATEAEFYGAMDGASKFVRGDAVAGLIITALNLLGGVAMGSMAGLSIGQATQVYSMLTIGDGLVSQIPALLVSTAAAVLVTKGTSNESLGESLISQVGSRPRATLIASGMLFMIGLVPGMPLTPFGILGTILLISWRATRGLDGPQESVAESVEEIESTPAEKAREEQKQSEDEALELLSVDRIALEIGYRLIPLVQNEGGTGILAHISQLRRRMASSTGVILPPVRIRDNIRMEPGGYRIMVGGQEIAGGQIEPGQLLAMDGGNVTGKMRGKKTVDPAFGLPAWWISENQRDEAELMGYTVIDPTSVLVTHLAEMLQGSYHEILSRDDVKELVDNAKNVSPTVVTELVPEKMGYGDVQCVLRNLIKEGIPVRNMPAILEALADNVAKTRDTDQLTELVRQRLGRAICEIFADEGGTVHAVTLEPGIEARLAAAVGGSPDSDAEPVNPAWLQSLIEKIGDSLGQATSSGKDVVLLARSNVRRFLGELVTSSLPKVAVLSYNEVVPARSVETRAIVTMDE